MKNESPLFVRKKKFEGEKEGEKISRDTKGTQKKSAICVLLFPV